MLFFLMVVRSVKDINSQTKAENNGKIDTTSNIKNFLKSEEFIAGFITFILVGVPVILLIYGGIKNNSKNKQE